MSQSVSEAGVWQALEGVHDPEIPAVNIVEMGMVRGVSLEGERARVRFTPTFSGCPALHVIRADIRQALEDLGLQAEVETSLTPPWTTGDISEAAREKLRRYGIAPPAPLETLSESMGGLMQLEAPPLTCPHCGSLDTRLSASFGSALCKRMYVCQTCKEPFEGMKSV